MLVNRVRILTFVLTMVGLSSSGIAQTWSPVWDDQFSSGTVPDGSKWTFQTGGGGWGNQELQNYTNRIQNSYVTNGNLVIEARKEVYQGSQYTSARINSAQTWTYGKIDIRAKIASGRGSWPAIWMLAGSQVYGTAYWPDNGEIDIMEHVGYDPGKIHCSNHMKAYNFMQGNGPTNFTTLADPFNTYATYTTEWRPHEVRTLVNGFPVLVWARQGGAWERWPFNQPFKLLLNIAVGGTWGGAQGIDNTIFPTRMTIDSVALSKVATTPYLGAETVLPARVQAEDFDKGGEGFAYHDLEATNLGPSTYRVSGVDLNANTTEDGTPSIGWIEQDEWMTYSVKLIREMTGNLSFRVGSPNSGKRFEVQIDDKVVATNVVVPNTQSWSLYKTVTLPNITLTRGSHKIRVIANDSLWNFNWFQFTPTRSKLP
ncbi:MAG: family 16 glycosylhydrolase [Armatimonadetes bacterium]|nr:family 16 glycosylhydrolase [Armatimonadota bacterium]